MHLAKSYNVSNGSHHGDRDHHGHPQLRDDQSLLRTQHRAPADEPNEFLGSTSLPNDSSFNTKSANIPIKSTSRNQNENQAESEADHRDFQFYSRLVNGIQGTLAQQPQPNHALHHQNKQCLDNIERTRQGDAGGLRRTLSSCGFDDHLYTDQGHFESEDEGIFELDL
eukprot:scaffold1231_cov107-Cylindrotheca_fusiformis.AAC.6